MRLFAWLAAFALASCAPQRHDVHASNWNHVRFVDAAAFTPEPLPIR